MATFFVMGMLLFRLSAAAEITNIQLYRDSNNNNTSTGLVLLKYDGDWVTICYDGDKKNWDKREALAACRQLQFKGGWVDVITDITFPTKHLKNFDCAASLSNLQDCSYDYAGECLDSKLAGVQCYDSFDVRLIGGPTPNAGRVEVKYDNMWSSVCYESARSETRPWRFSNVQVVCREVGFPGVMFARQGGVEHAYRRTIMDGYYCREDLPITSLQDCHPNPPVMLPSQDFGPSCGNGSTGIGNDAVAICAVPGYVGCYENNGNTQMKLKQMQSSNMTISTCRKHCMTHNYTHAFLHKGDTCFCGTGTTLNHVDDSRCGKECTGDFNQVCGHKQTLSVYNVMSGMCDDPLNGTNIYYYGDIFDNFKCDCRIDLVGHRSKQCVMGESPDEMKWIDIFPQCQNTCVSKHNLGIKVGTAVVCFFLLLFIVIAVVALFIRKQHTHRKANDTAESNEMATVEEQATPENTVPSLKKSGHNTTKKTGLIETLFDSLPFSSMWTVDDANTVSCECPRVEVDNIEEKNIHQKESTSGKAKSIREIKVKGDTRLAEIDSQGNTRDTQNKNKKKKKKKFKIKKENKKGKNRDTYEQVPYDDQCLAETDEKSADNALKKDEESKNIKEKHGVVDAHTQFLWGL